MLRVLVSLSAGLSALVAVLVGVESAGQDLPDFLMLAAVGADAFSGAALAAYIHSDPTDFE